MARVHLFTSSTQPYHYNKQGSPHAIAEEPLLSEDIIDNTTIVENASSESDSSPKGDLEEATQLVASNAALTAALLENARDTNTTMAEAVAAALSVKADSAFPVQQQQAEAPSTSKSDKPEDALDQAAAATALQLLGLSSQAEESKDKDEGRGGEDHELKEMDINNPTDNILINHFPGLTANVDDIDLSSEEMAQDYKRGTWTREEDELLLAGIKRYGYGRWKEIANSIPGRKGKQLKQRWDNTLASKYVDQEWLKNKIKHDQELHLQQQQQQQQQQQSASSSTSNSNNTSMDVDKQHDDKALKFLEATDWNDIAIKITEKAREGDQHAIEALLSQALLGSVAAQNTSTHHDPSTSTTVSSAAASPHPVHTPVVLTQDSTPNSPTNSHGKSLSSTTVGDTHDALNLNFGRSTINTHDSSAIHFDAAALALYAQQLSNSSPSTATSALGNSYFLSFNTASNSGTNDTNLSAAAAAAAAAVAVAHNQSQQHGQTNASHIFSNVSSPSTSSTPIASSTNTATNTSTSSSSNNAATKRRRSDPALADTQSAAMTIYASATPITTTINNQIQTVYPCLFPNCGKTFARLYNLKSHSRTHTDDRPFVCHACTAAFSRNHDLKRHSKIHGGDKPYKCNGCKKSFSRLDALKRHKSNQRNKQACTED